MILINSGAISNSENNGWIKDNPNVDAIKSICMINGLVI
jgi:hypothetical protein